MTPLAEIMLSRHPTLRLRAKPTCDAGNAHSCVHVYSDFGVNVTVLTARLENRHIFRWNSPRRPDEKTIK
jgi:hypothetical protein